MLSRCQCIYFLSHGVTPPPPLQDKDLKQYMDDCGNIMSMHNVKVRTTCTNIYTFYSAVSLQTIFCESFLFCIFIPSQDNEMKQIGQVRPGRQSIVSTGCHFCMKYNILITWRPYILCLSRSSCSKFYGGCRTVTRGKFSTGTWSLRTSSSTRGENSNWLILVRGATAAFVFRAEGNEGGGVFLLWITKKNVQTNCMIISSCTLCTESVLPCCVNSPHVYLRLWWGWQVWRGPSLSRLKPTPMRWWLFGTGLPTFCWDHLSIRHRSTCGRCLYSQYWNLTQEQLHEW